MVEGVMVEGGLSGMGEGDMVEGGLLREGDPVLLKFSFVVLLKIVLIA